MRTRRLTGPRIEAEFVSPENYTGNDEYVLHEFRPKSSNTETTQAKPVHYREREGYLDIPVLVTKYDINVSVHGLNTRKFVRSYTLKETKNSKESYLLRRTISV